MAEYGLLLWNGDSISILPEGPQVQKTEGLNMNEGSSTVLDKLNRSDAFFETFESSGETGH